MVSTYLVRQELTLSTDQAVEGDWLLNYLIDNGAIVFLNGGFSGGGVLFNDTGDSPEAFRSTGPDHRSIDHVQPLSGIFIGHKFETDEEGNLYKKVRPNRDFQ